MPAAVPLTAFFQQTQCPANQTAVYSQKFPTVTGEFFAGQISSVVSAVNLLGQLLVQ